MDVLENNEESVKTQWMRRVMAILSCSLGTHLWMQIVMHFFLKQEGGIRHKPSPSFQPTSDQRVATPRNSFQFPVENYFRYFFVSVGVE